MISLTSSATANFDRIARPYRWLEYLTLGRALEKCRFYFLPRLPVRRKALVLGGGDGRFTSRLLLQNPSMHADVVDISPAMLKLLTGRCARVKVAGRLVTHNLNALDYTPAPGSDLVVSHFFLDCFTQPELDRLIDRIAPTVAPGALWLVSDFRIPAGSLRLPAKLLVGALYLAFRLLTGLHASSLPNHERPLSHAGFTRIQRNVSFGGILFTELWHKSSTIVTEM